MKIVVYDGISVHDVHVRLGISWKDNNEQYEINIP